ncbi:tail protein [Alcaligenes phage vB_Af_QDWS595]|uniref:Uncharacterized protein n=1 Tax=Alcaligenes phage vB_Af_QDWS595 TaxID=2877946 RepID=A0AAE9BZW5_9CAUD|nr:tail protein [Alcaligenes phage vB_Af_QDWS595]UCR75494.1 hypothetical protein vBAfaPQDWS595_10 [Alcaligenes phage vB_Af_QDWS595]
MGLKMGIGNIQNPYQTDYTGLVDQQLGTAYLVVKEMVKNLGLLNQVSHYMPQLVSIGNAIDELLELEVNLPTLNKLAELIDEIIALAPHIINVSNVSDEIVNVDDSLGDIINVSNNIGLIEDASSLLNSLSEDTGASKVGTLNGSTVQEYLDSLTLNLNNFKTLLQEPVGSNSVGYDPNYNYQIGSIGRAIKDIPSTLDPAGTAAALIDTHNHEANAHPELTSFITAEANRAESAAQAATVNSNVYDTVADGMAASSDGEYFLVVGSNANEIARLFKRVNSGSSSLIGSYPAKSYVDTKANIASPQFTGSPKAPSSNTDYTENLQLANLFTVQSLTRVHRAVNLDVDLNGVMVLNQAQSRSPVLSFTGDTTKDVIVEFPTDGAGYTRILRHAGQGNGIITFKHTGQSTSIALSRGDVVLTISTGNTLIRVGVEPAQVRDILSELDSLKNKELGSSGDESISYMGLYVPGVYYKKGDGVKFGNDYYRVKDLDEITNNMVKNPRFNQNGSGWQGVGNKLIQRGNGTYHLVTSGDKPAGQLILGQNVDQNVPTKPGDIWSASITVENRSTSPITVRLGLFFAGSTVVYSADRTIPASTAITVKHENVAATPGSNGVRITLNLSDGSGVPDGTEIILSKPIFNRGSTVLNYFDGSFPAEEGITYSWDGTVDQSISKKTVKIDKAILGSPGIDQNWTKYIGDLGSSGETENRPIGEYHPQYIEKSGSLIMNYMTRDRTIGFNWGSSALNITYDDGETWEQLHNFAGSQTTFIREMENGELLVGVSKTGFAEVYLSSGFRKGTPVSWSKVLQSHSTYTNFAAAWGVFDEGNMILLIDYGGKAGMPFGSSPKVPDGENARYAYMSLDFGKTWKIIFDLNEWAISNGYATPDENGKPQARGFHCHGIAFDKWWDRIWITFGDNATVAGLNSCGGTCYSDDFGKTWKAANWGKDSQHISPSNSRHQLVGIFPMEKCVLFGTDSSPNGIHRIDRSQGKHVAGEYIIDVAYAYSEETLLTHLCQGIYQAKHLPNQPVIFAFGAEGQSRKSFMVATYDGYNFKLIWESPVNNARGHGIRLVAGPTRQGNLVARLIDSIDGVVKQYQLIGECPTY